MLTALELVAGFLLGRASLLGTIFPFGPAFFSALRLAPSLRGYPAAVALAIAAGAMSLGLPGKALQMLTAIGLSELAARALRLRRQDGVAGMVVATAIAVALAGGIRALASGQMRELVVLPFEALLAALLVAVFHYGVGTIAGTGKLKAPSPEEILCAGVLLAAVASGLVRLEVAGLSLQNTVGALLVMALALIGGAPLGSAVGATYGVVSSISFSVSPVAVGGYAFAGLLAGIFRDLGKGGAALGFIVGQVIVTYYAASDGGLGPVMREAAVAATLILLVPRSWLRALGGALGGSDGMSLVGGGEYTPEAALRDLTGQRLNELARVFAELARAFEQAAPAGSVSAEEKPAAGARSDVNLPSLYAAIAERVCDRCDQYARCWEQDFNRTYKSMQTLWSHAEAHQAIGTQDLEPDLRRRCVRPRELVLVVNLFLELVRVNRYRERQVQAGREIVGGQLRGVSQIVEGLAQDVRERFPYLPASLTQRRKPRLECRLGTSRATKNHSLVSGDSHLIRFLETGKLLVALSDGMGAGPRAALESRATITLLERLLETGFSTQLAVQTINSILLLRSSEESFATLDLAIIDLHTGAAEFIKIGAAPSFLLRDGKVGAIKAASLPVGIINQVEVQSVRRVLRAGDLLVLASDGVFQRQRDPSEGEVWVSEFLSSLTHFEPQVISEALLVRALEGRRREVVDDITIVAISLQAYKREQGGREASRGWKVAEWRRRSTPV